MPKFVNLTPHSINEVTTGLNIPASGQIARVEAFYEKIGEAGGVPLYKITFGEVVGLPEPQSDTIYIVSAMVAQAAKDRKDLVSPGQLVRNDQGQPIGCQGFVVAS